jgi:hypothetical protein
MSNAPYQPPNLDRYVVIHVATTCDEHGVYVTKDSAEVIEIGWILLDAKNREEVSIRGPSHTLIVVRTIANIHVALAPERAGQAREHSDNSLMQ